jgi:hypothetical protein
LGEASKNDALRRPGSKARSPRLSARRRPENGPLRPGGHEGETQGNFVSECLDRVGTTDGVSSGIFPRHCRQSVLDGTLTFDDPAVADEAILPYYTHLEYPTLGSTVVENRFNWSFTRLLTPTLAVTFDSGWIHQNWPVGHTSGFATTDVGLKYEAFRDNRHEALVSVGLAWGIGHSGAQRVGADEPNTVQPGIFFGKGFGDLPDPLSWLRPFAITGAIVSESPVGSAGKALAPSPTTGKFGSVLAPAVETINWGFSIQYSTLYLTSRFTGGPPRGNH